MYVVPGRVDAAEAIERGLDLDDQRRVDRRGRIDHDASLDPLGMVRSQPVGQQPSERVAAHHDALELERIEQPENVPRMILHRVAVRRRVALAASTHVEREHVAHIPEARAHEPVEGMRVRRQAGREHERRARAPMVEVVHPDPVRLDEPVGRAQGAAPQRTTVAAHV